MMKRNVYIDCGYYTGNALKIYQDKGVIDDSWDIYAFEPNLKIEVPSFVQRKAVWVDEEGAQLQIGQQRRDSASIMNTKGQSPDELVEVETLDLSKFVASLPDTLIICSMDIEGAEYRILEKMLDDKTIKKITILDIEFHDRLMIDKTEDNTRSLLYELSKWTAVKMKGWI